MCSATAQCWKAWYAAQVLNTSEWVTSICAMLLANRGSNLWICSSVGRTSCGELCLSQGSSTITSGPPLLSSLSISSPLMRRFKDGTGARSVYVFSHSDPCRGWIGHGTIRDGKQWPPEGRTCWFINQGLQCLSRVGINLQIKKGYVVNKNIKSQLTWLVCWLGYTTKVSRRLQAIYPLAMDAVHCVSSFLSIFYRKYYPWKTGVAQAARLPGWFQA